MIKKAIVLTLAICLLASLAGCGGPDGPGGAGGGDKPPSEDDATVEITLWNFPVGDWGTPSAMSRLLRSFRREYPNIKISVEYLDYETGDARINEAIENGSTPDLVFESPERLIPIWGERGVMADLTDLWEEEEKSGEIYEPVRDACLHQKTGEYYVYPVCMSAHCMAINYDLFKEAGALQYLDEETRTWTPEGFSAAVDALSEYGLERVGVIYCDGQSGDQGTRALVNNLYGGAFTNPEHTRYIVDSEENIRALQQLYDLEGIVFDPTMTSGGALDEFSAGETAMVFCWNAALQVQYTVKNPNLNFTVLPMAFPTNDGKPDLQGGIWGFGAFDNGDEARLAAAKEFIRFVTGPEYKSAVQLANFWPVRPVANIYANDALMTEHSMFIQYVGDYYQISPRWGEARTAWWNMLQKIGGGVEVREAVQEFSEAVNGPD